jgi:hypothetical protein
MQGNKDQIFKTSNNFEIGRQLKHVLKGKDIKRKSPWLKYRVLLKN